MQLLRETNDKIMDVAYNSGYRHLGLFHQMFKKRYGMTPNQWRRLNGNIQSGIVACGDSIGLLNGGTTGAMLKTTNNF